MARRSFAWIAAVLMTLVVFQTAADGTIALSEVTQNMGAEESLELDNGLMVDGSDTDVDHASANFVPHDSPVYADIPGGSAECFSTSEVNRFSVSGVQANVDLPRMSRNQNVITFDTLWGTYLITELHPESLSLLDGDAVPLVRESYFSLGLSDSPTFPINGHILLAESSAFIVSYDLVCPTNVSASVATMEVTIDFATSGPPKITAKALNVGNGFEDARIIWSIFPSSESEVLGFGAGTSTYGVPLTNYLSQLLVIPEMSVTLGVPSPYQTTSWQEFKVDWNDAKSGTFSVNSSTMLANPSYNKVWSSTGSWHVFTISAYLVAGHTYTFHSYVSTSTHAFSVGEASSAAVIVFSGAFMGVNVYGP